MRWHVEFYQSGRGDFPVQTLIESLDAATYAKAVRMIRLLAEHGPHMSPPYAKKLQHRLYELRVVGKIQVRILYAQSRSRFVLLHAFIKKSQQIPTQELKVALARKASVI